MRKFLIGIFLFCLAATALIGISAISAGNFEKTTGKILITTGAATFYSLIGLTCVAQFGKRSDSLGKAGLVFCGFALAHAIYTTWIKFGGIELVQFRLLLVVVGLTIGHACLMMLINPRSTGVSALMFAAIGAVILNSIFIMNSIFGGSINNIQTIGILGIIATCATIAAPALNLSHAKS